MKALCREFSWSNGFKLFYEHLPSKLVSIGLLVKGGSSAQNANESGVAHFLEHAIFQGSQKYSRENIEKLSDKLNLGINAYTSKEHSLFSIDCLYDKNLSNVKSGIKLIHDLVTSPLLLKKGLAEEKQNIKSEYFSHYNKMFQSKNFKEFLVEVGHRISLGAKGLGNFVLGNLKDIENMSEERLKNYHRRVFVPRNMRLIVTGGLHRRSGDVGKIKTMVDELNLNPSHTQKINFDSHITTTESQKLQKFISQKPIIIPSISPKISTISLFFEAPSYKNTEKYIRFLLLERILNDYNGIGKGIYLGSNICGYDIRHRNFIYTPYNYIGLGGILLQSSESNTKKFNANFIGKYLEILRNKINDREIKKAKNKLIFDLFNSEGTPNSLMNLRAVQYLYYDKKLSKRYLIDLINKCDGRELSDVMEKDIIGKFKRSECNLVLMNG